MRRVYGSLDHVVAGHFQSILEAAGIPTFMKNANLSVALGDVPFTQCGPELHVVKDADYDRAIEVLAPYYATMMSEGVPGGAWICPKCREEVEASFGSCWNCGEPWKEP